ncbi:serine-rich adhesin for platelets isoform X1, partial [Biomphalaria glabrata]
TSALPPHLNFFNYSREELASRDEGQTLAPTTANKVTAKPQRESTPESSSTSSEANNEEVAEAASVSTPSPNIRGGNSLLAKRSAARASAGTPETARGIVSLRQGLQRKVSTSSSSSSLARFPVSSPSHLLAISSHTNCAITTTTSTAPRFRNKFYFTPEKPLSPPKASGVRPGEFTPPSLFSSTRLEASYLNRPHTFSPLVHSSSSSKVASLHSRSDSPSSRGSSTSTLSSSASQMHSPDTLLRKGATPDFSSGDNVLNVKHDCSYQASSVISPCACSHTKPSTMLECCTSVKSMCVSQVALESGTYRQPICHHGKCCVGFPTSHSLRSPGCSVGPALHSLPVNQCEFHSSGSKGAIFSSCGAKLKVSSFKNDSDSLCCHKDVSSTFFRADNADIQTNLSMHSMSLPDNIADNESEDTLIPRPHIQDLYSNKVTTGLNQTTSQLTNNYGIKHGSNVYGAEHRNTKHNLISKCNNYKHPIVRPTELGKRQMKSNIEIIRMKPIVTKEVRSKQSFKLKEKLTPKRYNGLSKHVNDNCLNRSDKTRLLDSLRLPGLIRNRKFKTRNKDNNIKLLRDRINRSTMANMKKKRQIANSSTMTQRRNSSLDFQKEFVKMLNTVELSQSSSQCSSTEKVGCLAATNSLTYDSDWSVYDLQHSDLSQLNNKYNSCGLSMDSLSSKPQQTKPCFEMQQHLLKRFHPVPSNEEGKAQRSMKSNSCSLFSKRSQDHKFKHVDINLNNPSDEILMLREEVISAFSKFNRKDVIASSIQAAKAVKMSEVDQLSRDPGLSDVNTSDLMSEEDVPAIKDQSSINLELSDVNTSGLNLSKDFIYPALGSDNSKSQSSQMASQKRHDQLWAKSCPVDCPTTQDLLSVFNKEDEIVTKTNFVNTKESNISVQADNFKNNTQISAVKEITQDMTSVVPKPAVLSLDLTSLQSEKPISGHLLTYPSEVSLALVGWSLDKPLTLKRNKQIQTNLCAAVGHCNSPEDPANSKISSLESVKSTATCASPTQVTDYCLCQKELEKHCAKLQECLCKVCKLKFGVQHRLKKDIKNSTMDVLDTPGIQDLFQNESQGITETDIKVPMRLGNCSSNPSCSHCIESRKVIREMKETELSLVQNCEFLSAIGLDLTKDEYNKVSRKHKVQECSVHSAASLSKVDILHDSSKINSIALKQNVAQCQDSGANSTSNVDDISDKYLRKVNTIWPEEGMFKRNTQKTLQKSVSFESFSNNVKKDEIFSDHAIDLSIKKLNSSVINSEDHVIQSHQNSAGDQSKCPTSINKKLFPFDLTEIFEWSIPSNTKKPKLKKQNAEETHFSHCSESLTDSGPKLPLKDNYSATKDRTAVKLNQNKINSNSSLDSDGSQKICHNSSQQDMSSDSDARKFLLQKSSLVSTTNSSLKNNQSSLIGCDNSHTSYLSTTSRNTEGNKFINNGDCQKNVNTTRRKHLTDTLSRHDDQHPFTNEDLSRLIESVAIANEVKSCKHKNSRKENPIQGSRQLVKSKSFDKAEMPLDSTRPSLWPQLQYQAPIMLHSYGSLITGEGFALMNGQFQHCQILNRRNWPLDVYHKNVMPSTSSCSLSRWVAGSKDSHLLEASFFGPPNNTKMPMGGPSHPFSHASLSEHHASTATSSTTLNKNVAHSSSKAGQRIHCLGKSIYLHHDKNGLKGCEVDESQGICSEGLQPHQQMSKCVQPFVLNLSTHQHQSDNSAVNYTQTNQCSDRIQLSQSTSKSLITGKSIEQTTTEDLHDDGMEENVDDVVIIEDEVKYSEIQHEEMEPSVRKDIQSSNLRCSTPVTHLDVAVDEPIDLHVSIRDKESQPPNTQGTLKETIFSDAGMSNQSENHFVSNDKASALLHEKNLIEFTQEVVQTNLVSNQCSIEIVPRADPFSEEKLQLEHLCEIYSNSEGATLLDFPSQEPNGSNFGDLRMAASSSKGNSNPGLVLDTDISLMNLGTIPSNTFNNSQLISTSQNLGSTENILEALMKELQGQIMILNQELHQGNEGQSMAYSGYQPKASHKFNPGPSKHKETAGFLTASDTWRPLANPAHLSFHVADSIQNENLVTSSDYQRILKTNLRSTLGAFTPVRVRSSGHHDSPSSSNKDSSGRNRAGRDGGVRSARKNLLDKLTSVVHQHSRRPRTENQTRVKAQNLKRLEPKIRSNKTVREKSRKLVKKSQKEMKTKRRISLRLSCKTEGRSRRIEQNCEAGKDEKKQEESDGSHDNKFRRNNQAQKKRNALKTRQPYKIHPLERVRTRGYNLLLASQLAVKRAKREKALIKKKVNGDTRHKEETVEKVVKNVEEMDKLQVNSVKKMQLSPDVSNTTLEENKQQSSDETKRTLTNSKSKDLVSSCQNRERKESLSNSPKRTPPKKAKLSSNSSPPPHTLAEDTVPVFHPTEAEFMNPLTFISKIQPIAEPYGMCRIIPPASWKLDSNKISDDVRFTPQVQQIHRLHKRWGPNVQHTAAINQHLLSENANITTTPQIGGVQIDLPQLYRLVEESGGPKIMSDKKHWARIADIMNIPKQAMDRTVRLYDIYCHHVFPYFTLSKEEKHQLEEEVKAIYELQTVEDEAITKGKSMPVSWFSRIARNVQSMWFKDDPTASQVETEYWKIVDERTKHVSVQCGHINTRAQASAFPTRKDSAYSRHPWNLNNIPESASCLLKYLGPVSGISIPTLHMGMLFSTSCWSTDPHCLPYIQYLHTGSDIIWYCIPKSQRSKFRTAMLELAPSLLSNKPRWLKEDCVMVNPSLLKQHGVKVHCCVHSPRQFVVVFPGAYTATISCGYNVSESVHFVVSSKWLPVGMDASFALTKSGERELFSMCALLCGLMQDDKVDAATLSEALPLFSSLVSRELEVRTQLHAAGLRSEKRSVFAESPPPGPNVKKRFSGLENEKVCEICDRICYLSMVLNEQDEQVLCLEHGLKHVQKKKNLKLTRLFLRYNQSELETMLKNAKEKLTYLNSKAENCPPSSSNISNKSKSNNKQPI